LVVTNAAGAIRNDLRPGGILLIKDHINLLGANPLAGLNLDEFGPRFLDMTEAYDEDGRALAKSIARKNRIPLPEGVYAAVPGPSYETPAEIKMLATMGADVIGMSTVPEVIVARHHGMKVLGLSCVTNHAAGVLGLASEPITHEEVLENTRRAAPSFATLLTEWITTYEPRA
ncbi:MAG: purine-nucleoside phosphorylase, partial [Pseudomonadota bacterium]